MSKGFFLCLVFVLGNSVFADENPDWFAIGMDLAKKTMTATSVEERQKLIKEIEGLPLEDEQSEQLLQIVKAGERNFQFNLDHMVNPRKALGLVRRANAADSWEERRNCIRKITELKLLPQYKQQFDMILRSGERRFRKRVGNPPAIPQSQPAVPTTRPDSKSEVKAASVDVSVDRFVMIVHGWNPGPGTIEKPRWPLEMGLIYAQIIKPSVKMSDFKKEAIGYSLKFDNVQILVVDWSQVAKGLLAKNKASNIFIKPPQEVFQASKEQGNIWGELYRRRWLKSVKKGPSRVHLIAHSLGCMFVDAFCRKIVFENRRIQITFLDAYIPNNHPDGTRVLGGAATFTEHYLHKEERTPSIADVYLSQAYNVDVSSLVDFDGNLAEDHAFPYRWYIGVLTRKDLGFRPGPMSNVIFGNAPSHSILRYSRGVIHHIYKK